MTWLAINETFDFFISEKSLRTTSKTSDPHWLTRVLWWMVIGWFPCISFKHRHLRVKIDEQFQKKCLLAYTSIPGITKHRNTGAIVPMACNSQLLLLIFIKLNQFDWPIQNDPLVYYWWLLPLLLGLHSQLLLSISGHIFVWVEI